MEKEGKISTKIHKIFSGVFSYKNKKREGIYVFRCLTYALIPHSVLAMAGFLLLASFM